MAKITMNWRSGFDGHEAHPFKGVVVTLVENSVGRHIMHDSFRITFRLDKKSQVMTRVSLGMFLLETNPAKKAAREWLEANRDRVLKEQAAFEAKTLCYMSTAPTKLLNEKIDLQGRIDVLERKFMADKAVFDREYDLARSGVRKRSEPTGGYHTVTSEVADGYGWNPGGWFDEPGSRYAKTRTVSERVATHHMVPDYPTWKVERDPKIFEMRRRIAEIDKEMKQFIEPERKY
jgi:hypothetical protein